MCCFVDKSSTSIIDSSNKFNFKSSGSLDSVGTVTVLKGKSKWSSFVDAIQKVWKRIKDFVSSDSQPQGKKEEVITKGIERKVVAKQKPATLHIPSSNIEGSIQQLSEELLVSEAKLKEKAALGKPAFDQYIQKKREKYGAVIDEAKADYQKIFANYEIDKASRATGLLKPKNASGHAAKGLTEDLLMKIVRRSALDLAKLEKFGQKGVEVELKNYPNWSLLAKRENGTLHIAKWSGQVELDESHDRFLGRGSFGLVQKIDDIGSASLAAFKFSLPKNPDNQNKADVDVINEAKKLSDIHGDSVKDGLQAPPHAVFHITNRGFGEKNIIGYMQKLYNHGGLIDAVIDGKLTPYTLNKKQGLMMMKQLFSGLDTLHANQRPTGTIIHGDLKGDNIFVEQDQDGNFNFAIADLGDAKNTKNELVFKNKHELLNLPLGTVASVGYFTEGDWDKLEAAFNSNNHKEWIRYQKKRDTFATAASIWTALTADLPYPLPSNGRIFPNTSYLSSYHAVKGKYGASVASMLASALNENPDNRPLVQDILNTIETELAKN